KSSTGIWTGRDASVTAWIVPAATCIRALRTPSGVTTWRAVKMRSVFIPRMYDWCPVPEIRAGAGGSVRRAARRDPEHGGHPTRGPCRAHNAAGRPSREDRPDSTSILRSLAIQALHLTPTAVASRGAQRAPGRARGRRLPGHEIAVDWVAEVRIVVVRGRLEQLNTVHHDARGVRAAGARARAGRLRAQQIHLVGVVLERGVDRTPVIE